MVEPLYTNEPPRKKFLCFKGRRPPLSRHPDRMIICDFPDFQLPDNKISTSKYTLYDFLPKNLLEQFSKPSNFYFLIIGLLQIFPAISNSNNLPTIYLPLFVIIMISMIKDCFEDLKRHNSDKEENNRKVLCLQTNKEFKAISWEELRVGNVIKIMQGEYLPSDLLLLDTNGIKGECFIETKNLDGETNLKYKCVPNNLLGKIQDYEYRKMKATFEYEKPNAFLYNFAGKITIDGADATAVDIQNFVLRGCSLQNTKWILGVVAYTGHDSKIMLNSVKARPKYSQVDRLMNKQIRFIFIVQNIVCLFSSLYGIIWYQQKKLDLNYLEYQSTDLEESNIGIAWARNYGVWILILTNFVPISLLVTLEMVKFIQGIFISKDKRLRSTGTETKIFTEVHSSNLNEELGQINYIFSDKTGTLTKNIMEFKFLCVGEISYGDRRDLILEERNLKPMDKVDFLDRALFDDLNNQFSSNYKAVNEALLLLAVTHNIIIEEIDGEIIYNASSPDELSLVNFARFCGFMYKGIINNEIIINKTKYKFLHFLEFTSARKRSSIILENESNQVVLFCKGADSVIFERMIPSKYLNSTKNHLETYALVGLRTLVLAKRIIPRKEFEAWNNKYYEATICLANREKKMTDLQDEIEKELELVGATAIEDKLQDNVGDTIASLKEAGIQIWVLTGDKIETAINIGFSCKLLNDSLEKVLIDGKTKEEVANGLKQGLSKVTEKDSNQCFGNDLKGDFALVISGDSLIIITQDPDYCATMLAISDHCKAILACRVSPKQKGELVSLVRKEKPKITTLAIGDGANDVNMITAAHVGLGIKGVEGQQAARASDYAIGEFQLLRRLILYVGRESYRKNASLICYNFYKNMVLVLPLFWFAFFNGFSGQILYDPWLYQLFNVFYCSLPIILYALFDEEYPNNRVLDVFDGPGNFLETNPKFYAVGLKSLLFNTQVFWYWIMNGVFHSVILTAFTFLITSCNFTVSNGKDSDLDVIGEILYIGAVIFGNLKILIFSYVYFPFTVSLIFASVFFYVMNYYVINVIDVTMDSYGAFSKTFGVGIFYVLIILVIAFTMLTDLAVFRLSELGGEGEFDDDSSISFEEEEYEGEDNVSAMEMLEYPKKDYNGNNKSNSNDYSKNDNNKL